VALGVPRVGLPIVLARGRGILLPDAGERGEAKEAPRLMSSAGEPACETRDRPGRRGLAAEEVKPAREAGRCAELFAAMDRRDTDEAVGIEYLAGPFG
jgi:hypothetical protein